MYYAESVPQILLPVYIHDLALYSKVKSFKVFVELYWTETLEIQIYVYDQKP